MLIDIDSKNKDEILQYLIRIIGKPKDILAKEAIAQEKKENPANFGVGCKKSCMCNIFGQVPCPSVVPLPDHMRFKKILEKRNNE